MFSLSQASLRYLSLAPHHIDARQHLCRFCSSALGMCPASLTADLSRDCSRSSWTSTAYTVPHTQASWPISRQPDASQSGLLALYTEGGQNWPSLWSHARAHLPMTRVSSASQHMSLPM